MNTKVAVGELIGAAFKFYGGQADAGAVVLGNRERRQTMKNIGIGVDNYKINKFKKALADLGYTEVEVSPLFENTSLLSIQVPDDKVHDIHRLCIKLQTDFNRSN